MRSTVILDQAEIHNTDIFIGILWNRFGTPTVSAQSGTEEEFDVAYRAWEQHKRPRIMFYFCQRPVNLVQRDELEQKLAVLKFQERIGGKGIYREFGAPQDLESSLRQDITKHLLNLKRVHDSSASTRHAGASPSAGTRGGPGDDPTPHSAPDGMIRIPAGDFLAGRAPADASILYEYYIDEAPVTNADIPGGTNLTISAATAGSPA